MYECMFLYLYHVCGAGRHIALSVGLHAQLVHAVCTLPQLQPVLVGQLVSYLGAYHWGDPLQAAWLSSLIPELVDAVQSTEGSLGTCCRLADMCTGSGCACQSCDTVMVHAM